MHKLFLIGLFSLFSLVLIKAQTSIGLDLNYLQSFQEFSYVDDEDLVSSFGSNSRIHLGVGLQRLKENRVFHEYSLVAFGLAKDALLADDCTKSGFNLMLRWEYGKYFIGQTKDRLQLGGALSIDPSLFRTSLETTNAAIFPISATRIEADIRFIPRVKIQLAERLNLVAKLPIRLASLAYESSLTEDPAQALEQNRQDILELNAGVDRFQMNVGFRWTL